MTDRPLRLRAWAGVSVLLAAPALLWAADAGNPKSYALTWPVVLTSTAALQRLHLPADVLLQLQTANYSDLRLFNAQGQAIPMALAPLALAQAGERNTVQLTALPIMGASQASAALANLASPGESVSMRIEEHQGKRVVQINTRHASESAAQTPQVLLGALLDARAIVAPVVAVTLDVDLPKSQPITFKLQASKDLKTWRHLASTVLYRSEQTGSTARTDNSTSELGSGKFELPFSDLKDHYLRVTWADARGQLPAITLRSANLTTATPSLSRLRVKAKLTLPATALIKPHELRFSLPFATALAALEIKPQGVNVLLPVRVLGRKAAGQPWTPLASGVAYALAADGAAGPAATVQSSGALELAAASFREIKIEADPKTPGFAALPDITLLLEPAQIVFLTSGAPPFSLAAGLPQAAPAYLPIQSLLPGYQSAQENTLPLAHIQTTDTSKVSPSVSAQDASDGMSQRNLVLWAVLLAATLALALMAWVLIKPAKPPQDVKRESESA